MPPVSLKVLTLILLLPYNALSHGASAPCSDAAFKQFDFWLGRWNLSWLDQNGQPQQGRNDIKKILNGCVIEERFSSDSLQGHSVSTYDTNNKQWQQTWVDNQGSYLVFTGGRNPQGNLELKMPPNTNANGDPIVRRMVFKDIKADSFTWHWQASTDQQKTWQDRWVIQYQRDTKAP